MQRDSGLRCPSLPIERRHPPLAALIPLGVKGLDDAVRVRDDSQIAEVVHGHVLHPALCQKKRQSGMFVDIHRDV